MSYFSFSNWFIIGFERRHIPNENSTSTVANKLKKTLSDLTTVALLSKMHIMILEWNEEKRRNEKASSMHLNSDLFFYLNK